MKKILGVILSIFLFTSLLPLSAYANTEKQQDMKLKNTITKKVKIKKDGSKLTISGELSLSPNEKAKVARVISIDTNSNEALVEIGEPDDIQIQKMIEEDKKIQEKNNVPNSDDTTSVSALAATSTWTKGFSIKTKVQDPIAIDVNVMVNTLYWTFDGTKVINASNNVYYQGYQGTVHGVPTHWYLSSSDKNVAYNSSTATSYAYGYFWNSDFMDPNQYTYSKHRSWAFGNADGTIRSTYEVVSSGEYSYLLHSWISVYWVM